MIRKRKYSLRDKRLCESGRLRDTTWTKTASYYDAVRMMEIICKKCNYVWNPRKQKPAKKRQCPKCWSYEVEPRNVLSPISLDSDSEILELRRKIQVAKLKRELDEIVTSDEVLEEIDEIKTKIKKLEEAQSCYLKHIGEAVRNTMRKEFEKLLIEIKEDRIRRFGWTQDDILERVLGKNKADEIRARALGRGI